MTQQNVEITAEPANENISINKLIRQIAWTIVVVVVAFLLGLGSGYWKWGQDETAAAKQQAELARLYEQVNPKEGYALPVSYGDLGPQLIEAGVIDNNAFQEVMTESGEPITSSQMGMLTKGSAEKIVITSENAHFLLNFFWAVGLANRNKILTEGPMVQYSNGQIEGFASTGGWTLATKPIAGLYASMDLISLTAEQQARLEEVATAVYRPCCNNYSLFPDCNHGMAMLGLLELMSSQNASVDEMFNAAKYVNAYWFPQQTLETAIYLKTNQGTDFAKDDARLVVGKELSSASGAGMVHQSLQSSGQLQQTPSRGGGCAN